MAAAHRVTRSLKQLPWKLDAELQTKVSKSAPPTSIRATKGWPETGETSEPKGDVILRQPIRELVTFECYLALSWAKTERTKGCRASLLSVTCLLGPNILASILASD